MYRTEYCGAFTEKYMGQPVSASGWVMTKRDMGGVIFVDLYDKEGVLQVVFNAQNVSEELFEQVERVRNQSVVKVTGVIRERDEETLNLKIPTGHIELFADTMEILSESQHAPFTPEEQTVREELRLQYRYVDLRSETMQHNLRFRHRVQKVAQEFLDDAGFISVETPMLTKSTPEGARDYVVPSRVHPGEFYALPQSPQLFKQLLMVGGVDKYYQIARCFRDEDLRADRQPEFTQIDMEMAFVTQEDVMRHLEAMSLHIFNSVMDQRLEGPFERLTWHQAMDRYGTDKPDLRYELPIVDLCDVLKNTAFNVFKQVLASGGVVRAINVPGGAAFTRNQIDTLTDSAVSYGAKGMAWIAVKEDGEVQSILNNYLTEEEIQAVLQTTGCEKGDFVLFCADSLATVRRTLGNLRIDVATMQNLIDDDVFKFLFVTDFPQFEWCEESGRYIAMHHPFTMPYPEDVDKLMSDPGAVRAQSYDLVLNGVELGSGSVRIHSSDVQTKMFKALGIPPQQIEERFGFLVKAFQYGTPPHGGFAFGFDRLVMLLLGAQSLREVIAFPKTRDASCPLTEAPTPIDKEQLEVLGLLDIGQTAAGQEAGAKAETPSVDVQTLAESVVIKLTDDEATQLQQELEELARAAGALAAVDTDGVPPTLHMSARTNVTRPDVVEPSLPLDEVLRNAPATEDGSIFVPQVID